MPRAGENAVDLAFALMGLQNQFDLEDFDRHKQAMLVALIVACPTEVAP
jgi:telomere length regulation protein